MCGIGLPHIELKTFAAAISDWKNTFLQSKTRDEILLDQLNRPEKLFLNRFLKSLLQSLKMTTERDVNGDQSLLKGNVRCFQILDTTKTKEI